MKIRFWKNKLINYIKKKLKIQSPSKIAIQNGKYILNMNYRVFSKISDCFEPMLVKKLQTQKLTYAMKCTKRLNL